MPRASISAKDKTTILNLIKKSPPMTIKEFQNLALESGVTNGNGKPISHLTVKKWAIENGFYKEKKRKKTSASPTAKTLPTPDEYKKYLAEIQMLEAQLKTAKENLKDAERKVTAAQNKLQEARQALADRI